MLPLLHLVKFKAPSAQGPVLSHSRLVDLVQIHVRNVFLFFFGLTIAKQFFGDTILCRKDGEIADDYRNMKCLMNGTYTEWTDGRFYHFYYQWIPILLLLMALNFHLPCRIWYRSLSSYLNEITDKVVDEEACERVFHVVTLSKGNGLFWKTFALECLYMTNLAAQIWLLTILFPGCLDYSTAPSKLFPLQPKCDYYYWGIGGEKWYVYHCLLPLSVVYTKMYWVVYVLMPTLMVLHVLVFGYRLYKALTLGLERVDMWWCMQVAASRAQTWYARKRLQEMSRDLPLETRYSEPVYSEPSQTENVSDNTFGIRRTRAVTDLKQLAMLPMTTFQV